MKSEGEGGAGDRTPKVRARIASVIGVTLATWTPRAIGYIAVSFAALLPMALADWLQEQTDSSRRQLALGAASITLTVFGILLASGALAVTVKLRVAGHPAPLRRAWVDALKNTHRIIILFIFLLLISAACWLIPITIQAFSTAPESTTSDVLVGLAAIVANLILMSRTILAAPILIIERVGSYTAIRRSWKLTRGHRLGAATAMVGLLISWGILRTMLLSFTQSTFDGYTDWRSGWLGDAIGISLIAVFATAFYSALRDANDGISNSALASVFD